jgi:hypothetical protein
MVERAVAKALGREQELKALEDKKAAAAEAVRRAEEAERLAALEAMLRPDCREDDEHCRFVFRTQTEKPKCFQVDQRSGIHAPENASVRREPFNTTAFWIMSVEPVVIKDHGDIWNLSFVEMLGQLMAPRGFFDPGAGRIQLRVASSTQ